MEKTALRRDARARRQALPPAEVARRSQILCEQLFRHYPVAQWRWLHIFLPLTSRNEPDTWRIIHRIWAESRAVRLAVPVVQPNSAFLKHYELTPNTPLEDSRMGIPEPVAATATEVLTPLLDAVLVPLLAADASGNRVGYGGGFYDRFLAQCRPDALLIGLSLLDDAPLDRIDNVLPTDVRLHAYLTPNGVWHF